MQSALRTLESMFCASRQDCRGETGVQTQVLDMFAIDES